MDEIKESLKRVGLIPDVLPAEVAETFIPSVVFSIVWPNGKEGVLGSEIKREDTLDEPNVVLAPLNLPPHGNETTYTLAMFDPDAPSKADPKYKCFRHWVITGLTVPAATSTETSNIIALKPKAAATPYRPPGPGPGSGLHRYIFLLFEEPARGINIPPEAKEYGAALEERRSWDALDFAKQYSLKLVGANYFLVHAQPTAA